MRNMQQIGRPGSLPTAVVGADLYGEMDACGAHHFHLCHLTTESAETEATLHELLNAMRLEHFCSSYQYASG
jgi:hypothetical protein